ncbi:UNVERIFIED_CONTAM: E3 ubiquitin-protein ligase CHIP [Sesamum calycinum]|uniref:RING-type E3 ubiquitin transferase n=1 Tax=Sesamum calycinum TaxID=2727403 RepID=A0AAW2SBK8_9LAMI
MEGFVDENARSNLEQLEALGRVFNKAAEDDTPTEVPDYLCCKITLDIFRDPVITPSGFTYERAVILDHLQKVGRFDPITRESLYPSQLVPNLAIKEAVSAYLEKHGWDNKMD